MAKSDITKDDPLGAILGGGAGKKDDFVAPDDSPELDDDGTMAAQTLLDAIHAKDAAGVRDAFSALSLSMKPPGEDDMEMAPSSESGAMIPGEE